MRVEFVRDFTDDFLKDIFKRDQPLKAAIFIDDQRKMRASSQKLTHLIVKRRRVGDEIGLHRHVFYVKAVQIFERRPLCADHAIHRACQVFGMDHANDIFLIPFEHWQARMGTF